MNLTCPQDEHELIEDISNTPTWRHLVICQNCQEVMRCPIIFTKCGHSPWCDECVFIHKPKKCPSCLMPHKPTQQAKNHTLANVICHVFPLEKKDEEGTMSTADRLCLREIENLRQRIQTLSNVRRLPANYIQDAAAVIRTNFTNEGKGVMTKCHCGLVCTPTRSIRKQLNSTHGTSTVKWFWGCPGFNPTSKKRSRQATEEEIASLGSVVPTQAENGYCNFFAVLSNLQKRKLSIELR